MKKIKLIFDGYPKKLMPHRVPFDERPMTGEFWISPRGNVVEITSIDPFGRWFNYVYVRMEMKEPTIFNGQIGQIDLEDERAYKIEFLEEVNKKELEEIIHKLEL